MPLEPKRRFVYTTTSTQWSFASPMRAAFILLSVLALSAQAAVFDSIQLPDEFNKIVDTSIPALTTNANVSVGTSTILEGPVWIPGNPGYLVFSGFNNNSTWDANGRLKKLVLPNTVTDYLPTAPPQGTVYNGSTLDMQERIISCQSGSNGLRVVMVTNNTVVTLVDRCNGLKFYSPNDVVVKSDGTIWFSDPQFNSGFNDGTAGFITGHNVYRFNPTNGNASCTPVTAFGGGGTWRPNGLCFSPDESILYIADWNNRRILTYTVSPNNTLSSNTIAISVNGNPDGIRCDSDGRVYSSSGSGVYVYMPYPDCRLIGRIYTGKNVANLCFGGPDRHTLFMTAAPYILSIPLKVTGAVWRKKVQVTPSENSVQVSWPYPSTDFQLQANSTLDTNTWTGVTNTPSISNGLNILQFEPTNPAVFYRLQIPKP